MATVQTELSKDGGSFVKAAEQFWKQQYESRWLGHSLQVYLYIFQFHNFLQENIDYCLSCYAFSLLDFIQRSLFD